ncbi:hypothetical protein [Nonomuraea zeae]|uniref:Uncharacterized protein n=1 Tax=Nonomuraea zeae TaxID=1642303 RepID=A0A5S4GSR3_9ACTN|nr:hypothetical protein [Nonomuraea zeae]TMR35985.1 hypothetical protein ETD85_12240 [Nonomuraea zeae]
MADSGSQAKTVYIWGDAVPTGETEPHPKAEIRRLLGTSQQELIKKGGSAYTSAAEAIINAVVGIEDHAGKILTIWRGPDADKARIALELVCTTGNQLAWTLAEMGRSLETYAGYIPTAIAEVDGSTADQHEVDAKVPEVMLARNRMLTLDLLGDPRVIAATWIENAKAQEALKRLNEKIRSLLISSVPININYELPAVAIPPTPGASISVEYRSGAGTQGAGTAVHDGGSGADDASVSGAGTGSGGSTGGAVNPRQDDGGPGGKEGAGPGTQPDDQPGQDQSAGQDLLGAEEQARDESQGSGDGSGEPAGSPGAGTGADTEDATAPPVIGAEDKTALGDATPGADPTKTETSSYQPTTAVTPATIGTPPVSTVTPTATLPPAATGPGVPSVIGSPSTAYTSGAGVAAMRGGSAAATSGVPFMPMMGGGGPMGDEGGDMERGTYLSEDGSAWSSSRDVTDPVIG